MDGLFEYKLMDKHDDQGIGCMLFGDNVHGLFVR